MEKDFKDKVVMITGGSRGIGKAVSLAFAARGASVAVLYLKNEKAARETVEGIRKSGAGGLMLQCDVRGFKSVSKAAQEVAERLGEIDVLVNCAGTVKDSLIVSMEEDDWRSVLETNLYGAFNCLKAAAERMLVRRSGRIINVSSISATKGGKGQANYAASKAGLNALTRVAALELAPRGITVNAVAPGMVVTEMSATVRALAGDALKRSIPVRRFAEPDDVTGLILFLASAGASYITGQVIDIDGGMGAAVHY